jgi:gliding motility-associated-like protein
LFTAEPKETTLSNPLINVVNQSVGAEEFLWRFGDTENSTLFEPNHSYSQAGNYCIWLIAKNDFGCVDSTKDCVKINPNYTLFVPNSFTPNGDGLNDVFIPLAQSVKEYEMTIFNRWGLKVFNSLQLDYGWDGGTEAQGAFKLKFCNTGKYLAVACTLNSNKTIIKIFDVEDGAVVEVDVDVDVECNGGAAAAAAAAAGQVQLQQQRQQQQQLQHEQLWGVMCKDCLGTQ